MDLGPGQRIGDRFVIERRAGSGGMGTVFRARDLSTGDPVAVKVLTNRSAEALARFTREARALDALRHPHIVTYVAHGVTPDGDPYLAMEWFEGEDLETRIARGPLDPAAALKLVARVAAGLAVVHAQGILHRDLKPSNLFLPSRDLDRVKILDFGIVRFVDRTQGLTHTGSTIGTPTYMAPEQARGDRTIDARADVFSLGCVLFDCLTGRPPFVAAHPLAVLAKLLFEEAPRPSELRPELPAGLDAFVARLLAKDPADRPADALTMAAELRALDALDVQSPGSAPGESTPTLALTRDERRLVSVVLTAGTRHGGRELGPTGTNGAAVTLLDLGNAAETPIALPQARGPAFELAALRQIAEQHGARLERLRDGSIAAVIPVADSPAALAASAARCALAIHRLLAGTRVALATGWDVIAGTQPMGQVIDRAATMLDGREAEDDDDACPILLDRMTVELLDDRFDVSIGEHGLTLAGEREPASEARKLLGRPTTCVGRDRELGALQAIFDECLMEPGARAVLVTAGAGVGKSRVRHEFVRRIQAQGEPVEVWIARGDSMRTGAPFGLLGQVVRRAARLLDGEPLELRQRKLAARVAVHVNPTHRPRVAAFLGEMVGTPFLSEKGMADADARLTPEGVQLRAARQDAKLMGDQTRRAWVDFMQAECRAHPVLLVLEDLHWGDRPTIDYVDTALRLLRDQPLMVLALARPEVRELFPGLWSERAVTELRLMELSRRACEKLVIEALGEAATEAAPELVERSAGNAFFLEELIRAVAEGRGGDVPETVLAVMQSRLEGLEPEARRLLRAGSVFGGAFARGAVEVLLGCEAGAPHLDEQLAELERRELCAARPEPTFRGETEYTFRHAMVREAAYGMLTQEDRQLGHRLAGAWLEQAGETDAMVLAWHFDQGGEQDRAIDWYRRAADQALESNDFAAALERADRAAACGAAGEALGDLDMIRAEAHRWRGELAAAEKYGLAAMNALPAGSARWYDAMTTAARTGYLLYNTERLVELTRQLSERWSEPAATGPQLIATAWTASLLYASGAHEDAELLSSRVEAVAPRFREDPIVSAPILRLRATRARLAGDRGGYRELIEATVRCYDQAGDVRAACGQRTNAGHACNELGAYAEAATLLRATLASAEQLGLRGAAAAAKHNLSRTLGRLGALEEARAMAIEAAEECAVLGNARTEAVTYIYLAEILRLTGDLPGAEAAARRGAESLTDTPPLRPYAAAMLCRVLLTQGRVPEALESARRARELAAALIHTGEQPPCLAPACARRGWPCLLRHATRRYAPPVPSVQTNRAAFAGRTRGRARAGARGANRRAPLEEHDRGLLVGEHLRREAILADVTLHLERADRRPYQDHDPLASTEELAAKLRNGGLEARIIARRDRPEIDEEADVPDLPERALDLEALALDVRNDGKGALGPDEPDERVRRIPAKRDVRRREQGLARAHRGRRAHAWSARGRPIEAGPGKRSAAQAG